MSLMPLQPISLLASWLLVLDTNVGSKLFVALAFILLLHFIQ